MNPYILLCNLTIDDILVIIDDIAINGNLKSIANLIEICCRLHDFNKYSIHSRCFILFIMYGKSTQKLLKQTLRIIKIYADHENEYAQYILGSMYLVGHVFDINYLQAFKYLKSSADKNYPPAQNNLGHMYEHGLGVKMDYSKCAKYYHQSAQPRLNSEHDETALNNLGHIYYNGIGVSINYYKSIKYYRSAIKYGSMSAEINLRIIFPGIIQDRKKCSNLIFAIVKDRYKLNSKLNRLHLLIEHLQSYPGDNPENAINDFDYSFIKLIC